MTADEYLALVETGVLGKVELWAGVVTMSGQYELVFSPEQAAAAAAVGVRVRTCVDAVLEVPALRAELAQRLAAGPGPEPSPASQRPGPAAERHDGAEVARPGEPGRVVSLDVDALLAAVAAQANVWGATDRWSVEKVREMHALRAEAPERASIPWYGERLFRAPSDSWELMTVDFALDVLVSAGVLSEP